MKTNFHRLLIPVLFVAALIALGERPVMAITDADIATLNQEAPRNGTAEQPAAPSLPKMLGQMSLALGVVFGLMWLVLWLVKRYLPQGSRGMRGGAIDVLASRSIGPRRSLMLVRANGRTLLLGVTPQSIQALADFEAEGGDWREAAWRAGLDAPGASGETEPGR